MACQATLSTRFLSSTNNVHDRTPRRRARPATKIAVPPVGASSTRTHRKRKSVGSSHKRDDQEEEEEQNEGNTKDDIHMLAQDPFVKLFRVPDGLGIHAMVVALFGGVLLASAAYFSEHEFLDQPSMSEAIGRVANMESDARLKFLGVTVAGATFWPLCSELNRLYLCRLALKSSTFMNMAPMTANVAAFGLSLVFLTALRFLSGYDLSIGGLYVDNACSFGLLYFGNFWVPLTWHVVGKSLLSMLWLDEEVNKFERKRKEAQESDK